MGQILERIVFEERENLTHLPNGFDKVHCLRHLETSSTPIQWLPTNFGNLARLEYLDMDFQHLMELPSGCKNFTNLQTLKTGKGAFNFPVPHLPNVKVPETSIPSLCRFDQASTVKHLHVRCQCKDTADASVLDSDLRYLSTWSHIVELNISFERDAIDYMLYQGFFSSFQQLTSLKVECDIRQLEIYVDNIACLKQLKLRDLNFCDLKSTRCLVHPAPPLNLETINLWNRNITVGFGIVTTH
ncbi:hypothetical protein IV203_012902 [Nitzschia inconspicua]|uniref:Uncharacterized protein n=1 Tax=Nitzschia inconspicua TaxID=303405 RepID=A0A9K3M4L7_9STRA|nr:hypothetical protein IV203_012902 [Nitzschia inconspicua]